MVCSGGVVALLLLLFPTILMGGSLPVLSRYLNHLTQRQALSVDVSQLYAWNTFGAISGTLLTGYFFLAHLGIATTNVLAAMVNFMVAGLFWLSLARREGQRLELQSESDGSVEQGQPQGELAPPQRRLLLATYGVSGVAAFIYEVAWTRALEMILGTTTYAFTVMLATFLLGIALGSAIYSRIPLTISRITLYLSLQMVVVVSVLFSSILLDQFPVYYLSLRADFFDSWFGVQFMRFLLASLVMLIPTTAMGILFPVVTALTVSHTRKAYGIGGAYGANTIGAAIGAALASLVLIPLWGMQTTILLGALLNFSIVLLLLMLGRFWRIGQRLQSAAAAAAVLFAIIFNINPWAPRVMSSGVYIYADDYYDTAQRYNRIMHESDLGETQPPADLWRAAMNNFDLLYYDTGRTSTVAVMENTEGVRSLMINGKVDASAHENATQSDLRTQEVLAHLPLMMVPRREQVFVVGLGSGITAGSVLLHPINNLHVAEISPAVIEAARLFERYNNGVLDAPRVSLFQMDARQRLRVAEPESYDVVISQPSNPWIRGESMLFTHEWYELVKSRLRPHGLFAQWIPAYNIAPHNLKVIIHTLSTVFPNLTIWNTGSAGDLLMIANKDEQFRIDYPQLMAYAAQSQLQQRLQQLGLDPQSFFFDQFVMGPVEVRKYLSRGARYPLRENTDDLLIIEYRTPKDMHRRHSVDFFVELEEDEFSSDSLLRVTRGLTKEEVRRYRHEEGE